MINVKKARQVTHPLKNAVSRQMGGVDCLYESASDIANCGANAGWGNFVYYSDTVVFYQTSQAKNY